MEKEKIKYINRINLCKSFLIMIMLLCISCSEKKPNFTWKQANVDNKFTITIPNNIKTNTEIYPYYVRYSLSDKDFSMKFHYGYLMEDWIKIFDENQKTVINNETVYLKLSQSEWQYYSLKLDYLIKHFELPNHLHKYTAVAYFPSLKGGETLFVVIQCNNKRDLDIANSILFSTSFVK